MVNSNFPLFFDIPFSPVAQNKGVFPHSTIIRGLTISISSISRGLQDSISSTNGARFSRPSSSLFGLQRHVLEIQIWSRVRPTAARILSSNSPALPINGSPPSSSSFPGASPISIIGAPMEPFPKTTRERNEARGQRKQPVQSLSNCSRRA